MYYYSYRQSDIYLCARFVRFLPFIRKILRALFYILRRLCGLSIGLSYRSRETVYVHIVFYRFVRTWL